MTEIPAKSIEEVPEVMAFEQAKTMLEAFKAQNPTLMNQLQQLVEHYNQTREAADKAVRGLGVGCGDFDLYQHAEKADAEKLLNALGRDQFISVGGSITTRKTAKISAKSVHTAAARGLITQDLQEEVVTKEGRYHTPSEIVLP